jgi:hypothetical protein
MAFAEDTLDKEKNYQWPASRLTGRDMAVLYRIREKTGIPISQLLKAAVVQFEAHCTDELLQTLKNGKAKKATVKREPRPKSDGHKAYRYAPIAKQPKPETKPAPESDRTLRLPEL